MYILHNKKLLRGFPLFVKFSLIEILANCFWGDERKGLEEEEGRRGRTHRWGGLFALQIQMEVVWSTCFPVPDHGTCTRILAFVNNEDRGEQDFQMQGWIPRDFLFVKTPFPLLFPNVYGAFPLSHTERKHFRFSTATANRNSHLRFDGCQSLWQRPQSRQGWEGGGRNSHTPLCFLCGWSSCHLTSSLPVKGPPASSAHGSPSLHVPDGSSSSPPNKSFLVMECLVNFCLRSAWPFSLVPTKSKAWHRQMPALLVWIAQCGLEGIPQAIHPQTLRKASAQIPSVSTLP